MTTKMGPKLITKTIIRRVELALVSIVLGTAFVILANGGSSDGLPHNELFTEALIWFIFFLVPLALAGTTLVAVVADEVGLGSLVAGGVALVTIGVCILAVYTLVAPSGGGVYFGHFFSYGSALVLSVVVLLRPLLDRLSASVWLRPGLINLS